MDRTRFIEHQGRRIVLLDYTGLGETEMLEEIERSRQFFGRQEPDGSLLTLTDVTDATYTTRVMEAMKALADHDKPFVKAGAVVTASRLHRVVIATVAVFTGRRLPTYATRDEALNWLTQQ